MCFEADPFDAAGVRRVRGTEKTTRRRPQRRPGAVHVPGSHETSFAGADGGTLFLDEVAEIPLEFQNAVERTPIRTRGRALQFDFEFAQAPPRG